MENVAVNSNLPDLDIRVVTIMWGGDSEERPQVSFTNCSEFEAWGMTEAAAQRFQEICVSRTDFEDEDDDDWEDEDDD